MKWLYYDFEIFKDFWLVSFQNTKGKSFTIHSRMDFSPHLDKLKKNKNKIAFIGYNNSRYDKLMLNYLFKYHDKKPVSVQTKDLYEISKDIINKKEYHVKLMGYYKIPDNTYQIDVMQFLMQGNSAKEMGCRLHVPKLQSLPFKPEKKIKDNEIKTITDYCVNDVTIVKRIVDELLFDDIEALFEMLDYWDLDKKYLSTTLTKIVELAIADYNKKPNYPDKWRYEPPVDFNFQTQQFKDIEETYKGLVLEPKKSFNLQLDVDRMEVSLGLGGAHGAVRQSYFENLIDIDINQFYPETKNNFNLLPNTIKDKDIYARQIDLKKKYKAEGNKKEKPAKLTINAAFGKMGDENSHLYNPDKMYQTTITGQLLQLRLIEDMRANGFEVVYLNTDGITILDNGDNSYKEVADNWAKEFGYDYKIVHFKRAYYKDVNNFVAEKHNGELKRKGSLSTEPSKKASCFGKVAVDAVVEHLMHGKPIREYVYEAKDLRDFLMYHKYNRNYEVFLKTNEKYKKLDNVVRYYISRSKENSIVQRKLGETKFGNRNYNKNVRLVDNFIEDKDGNIISIYNEIDGEVDIDDLDKEAYVLMAYDHLYKITGDDVEDNPYVERLIENL